MNIQEYARVIRKRWRLVLAPLLVALGAALALTSLTPKTYQSTVSFFVSTSDTSDSSQLAQGGTFTQQRVKSYTQLITTPKVLGPVAEKLHVVGGADGVRPMVSAKAATDTVMIEAAVTSKDPRQSAEIAREIGTSFPAAVADLERVSSQRPSPVKVSLVQQPSALGTLVGPSLTTNLVLGGFLGLLAGICFAMLWDRNDTKVRTREDLQLVREDISVLGAIPFDSDTPSHPLILEANAHTPRAEAFRSLRTNLRFVDAAKHPRLFVVTSALAGEGKSVTTANLALALATSGYSVCLIEGDLRRPRLLQYLGLEGGVGLTDVLIGQADLRDVAQRFGAMPLMVIGAGPTPPNPSELLGSPTMAKVLEDLRGRFDYVVIDAPPLLPVTDGAVLATMADGAILVSGAGIVHRAQVKEALDHLDAVQARLLGSILNRAPKEGRSSYYDYRSEEQIAAGRRGYRNLKPRSNKGRRSATKVTRQ